MKLTIYGRDVVLRVLFVTIVIDVIAYFVNIIEIKLILIAVSVLLFAFTLFFFRDPKRNIPNNILTYPFYIPVNIGIRNEGEKEYD